MLEYPKLLFFILVVLGESDYVREAKTKIDYINYLQRQQWDREIRDSPTAKAMSRFCEIISQTGI